MVGPDLEIQLTLCWIAAIVCALLVSERRWMIAATAIMALGAGAVLLPGPVFNYLMDEQELVVAFVVPDRNAPPDPQAGSSSPKRAEMNARVQTILRQSGISGEYRIAEVYHTGKGKPSLQVVVLDNPVTNKSLLPEPKATTIVYFQRGNQWNRIPANARVLKRSVEISSPSKTSNSLVYVAIPDASGVTSGALIGGITPATGSSDTREQ